MKGKKERGSVFSQDKIFLHGDRVREYLTTGGTSAPVTLELDLTNKCNNRCPDCTGYNEDGLEMKVSDAENTLSEAALMGVRGVIFSGGGEPLLHPQATELAEYAKRVGLDVGLITSGQANPKTKDLDSLVDSCSWIRISADAGSVAVYEETHGLNAEKYQRMWRFTQALVDKKKVLGSECTVGMGYLTGQRPAVSERYDIMRFARRAAAVGVDYAQLRPFHNTNRPADFPEQVRRELESSDTKLLTSAHKYDLMNGTYERGYDYCHGAHFASVVTADGHLNVCCHLRNQPLGRASEVNEVGLDGAWQDSLHKHKIRRVDVSECLPYCRCDHFNESINNLVRGYKNGHKNFL